MNKPFILELNEKKVPLSGAEALEIYRSMGRQLSGHCGFCGKEFVEDETFSRHPSGLFICDDCMKELLVEVEIQESNKVVESNSEV